MHRLKIFVILILCIAASCMAAESHVSLYGKWQNADNSHLMDIARDLVDRNSCDSALVCYSIVADRLRDNAYLQEDKKLLSRALNNISFTALIFFDYKAAVNALQESLKVSIESGYDENLSFVNLNLGGVYLGCNIMYGKKLFSDEVWNYLHRASESAVSSEQYEVAFVAFLNMGQMYFLDRQNEQMKEAISLLRRADVPADMPLAAYCDRYSRGLEAYMSGNYNQALAMFNSMKPLIPQGDLLAPKYELIILSAIADTCKELGDYAAAIETASLLLDLSSNLTAPESKRIADSVLQIMDNTEIITDPGFSLAVLAEHIGRSAKVVSQVVNETLGKNFKTLLGEYRIREACVRLLDTDTYGQYTIEHIAESVGFNSRSNFSVTFKKITGLTPAQFQKSSISDSGN